MLARLSPGAARPSTSQIFLETCARSKRGFSSWINGSRHHWMRRRRQHGTSTGREPSNGVQQRRNRHNRRHLRQRVGPDSACRRNVGHGEYGIHVQHERAERLLSERDEHGPKRARKAPERRERRVTDRQGYGQVQQATDPKIAEREVVRIQVGEALGREEAPVEHAGAFRPGITKCKHDERGRRRAGGERDEPWKTPDKRPYFVA